VSMANYSVIEDAGTVAEVGDSRIVLPNYHCEGCGRVISEHYSDKTGTCASCQRGENSTDNLERIYTVTIYLPEEDRGHGGIVEHISEFSNYIYKAKSGKHIPKMAGVLKRGIENFDNLSNADLITYPPSGEGGFNHMKEISERVADKVDIPSADITQKIEDYPSQKSTDSMKERINNVDGGIGLSSSNDVNFSDIDMAIVLDDVVVTGSTLSNTAQVLKSQGVDEVYGLAVSRNEALNHLIEYADLLERGT